jgi:hypothetical protein
LPIINKTKHPTKGEKKLQDGRTQVLANKESSKEDEPLGEWEQIKYPEPLIVRYISDKERGGTSERTLSLEEPSPTITHLKIKIPYTRCNATDTLCL